MSIQELSSGLVATAAPPLSDSASEHNQRVRLGQVLIDAKLITPDQLEHALERQNKWGSRLGDVILTMGWVRPVDFYRALAAHFQLDFVDLIQQPADASLLDPKQLSSYSEQLYLPWRAENGTLWIATADPTSETIEELRKTQPNLRVVATSKFDIIWELQRIAGARFSDRAVNHLATVDPQH